MEVEKQFFWRNIPWISPLPLLKSLQNQREHPMLFFSAKSLPEKNGGRFSFLLFSPEETLFSRAKTDFLGLLEKKLGKRREIPENAPEAFRHFCGGLAGTLSYDFGHELENFTKNKIQNTSFPTGLFQIFEHLVVFDHLHESAFVGGWFEKEISADVSFQNFRDRHITVDAFLSEENPHIPYHVFVPEITDVEYKDAFYKIQNELENGNTFQANFSQQWASETNLSSQEIFEILVQKNAAPMMFFLEHENLSVISCSPERLFSLHNGKIFTQPIAGTRRRGIHQEEDQELEKDLLKNSKELAEHSMLVDLLRNDFGRVAEFGTVHVDEFARVERYASVMHLVSDISAKLAPEKTVFDIVKAVFPGGTITGAPKVETMDILGRLEKSSRGVYSGSAGYFSFNGNADFNILIRTIQKIGKSMEVRAGGGIVVDSDAEMEYLESIQKAMGVIGALGEIN
ncbi:anthranilate synthase component I family protein [Candidatus Peregrinibacteria bacterium]|nr:anthranilate synthase component I family protein [Candidatus Peregrinibacteria bacterium]